MPGCSIRLEAGRVDLAARTGVHGGHGRWPCATAVKEGRGGAREDKETTMEPVAVDAGLPGARRWKNDGGPARAHGGVHGGRVPELARSIRERGGESGEASECWAAQELS